MPPAGHDRRTSRAFVGNCDACQVEVRALVPDGRSKTIFRNCPRLACGGRATLVRRKDLDGERFRVIFFDGPAGVCAASVRDWISNELIADFPERKWAVAAAKALNGPARGRPPIS